MKSRAHMTLLFRLRLAGSTSFRNGGSNYTDFLYNLVYFYIERGVGVSILGVVMDSPPPGGIPGSRDVIMTSQREFLKVTAVNVLVWSPGAIECATPRLAPSCLAVRGGYPRSSSGYFFYKKLHFDTATFQTWSVYPAPHVTSGSFFL